MRYTAWSRPFHLEMPVLTESLAPLMEYPHTDALVFCLPVAFEEQASNAQMRFEGYCKASLFLARQMLYHWDVAEAGVPIFIGVSENGMDIFIEYARRCEFPHSHIVELPSYRFKAGAWNSKFDLLGADRVAPFERRIHFDTSIWLRPQLMYRQTCRQVLAVWQTEGFLVPYEGVHMTTHAIPHSFPHRWVDGDYFENLASILGTDAEMERQYWGCEGVEFINGLLFGFSRSMWEQSRDLIADLCCITAYDEVVLGVVAREMEWASQAGILDAKAQLFSDMEGMPSVGPPPDISAQMQTWRDAHDYMEVSC